MLNKKISILFLIILFIPLTYALRGSLGNARAVVYVNATPENPVVISRSILVSNKNDIDIKVDISPDVKYASWVNVIDKEVVLKPNESKKAKYEVTIAGGGSFEIKFNVAFMPADPTVKDNSVGLLSVLTVISQGPPIEAPVEEPTEQPSEQPVGEPTEQPTEETQPNAEASTVNINVGNHPIESPKETQKEVTTGRKPYLGYIIMGSIVLVGLGIFFLVQKLR